MSVCNGRVLLWTLWMWTWDVRCDAQVEEVEIFRFDRQSAVKWTFDPRSEWNEVKLRLDAEGAVPVLQACGRSVTRTALSPWIERKDAHNILLDITFAQEEEPSGQQSPLGIHLFDRDTSLARFRSGWTSLELHNSEPFAATVPHHQLSTYFKQRRGLSLGSVTHKGLQLGFSYSGTCVFISSIRLYYRRCPDTVAHLASFGSSAAGSGPLTGSCVVGAVEVSPPVSECTLEGAWEPVDGGCSCEPGHQVRGDTCQACGMGYFKPATANDSAGCQVCPANTRTHREGSERCECVPGFSRLPTEPADVGCTKPPSAPVNLTAHHHNDSALMVLWDPPLDWGGRQELTYHVKCEEAAETGSRWQLCGDRVDFLPDSSELTSTSVSIIGVNPHHDYRLSVQAWNDISSLQEAQQASTATLTIHRWKRPIVVITVGPGLNISEEKLSPARVHDKRPFLWLTVGVLLGSILLMAVISIAVCARRQKHTRLRSDEDLELVPVTAEHSYRRPQVVEATAQQTGGVEEAAHVLEGLGGSLLANLKEVLVDRNKLTLGKELGKGQFGLVYEGVYTPQEGEDMKVAVKTMKVGIHCQEDLHEVLREAEIMRNFHHENVLRLIGVTLQREQDCPLLVPLVLLPYMKHGDLRRFLIATRYGDIPMFVPHQSLLRFMIDIAAGMNYLSSQGFLHRDLAARNCMLGDDLRVYVADFGLSKKIYSSNYYRQKVTVRVPVKWMSMESLSESVYTTKSDVWSFGVTMWEIVSRGRTPYPGVSNHELLDVLLSGHRLKPPKECDHKLYEAMKSCWEKEPDRRPGFAELGETLKGLLSELPVLEASQEASYINQGLEAAAAAVYLEPQVDSGGRCENVYLPSPVAAVAARDDGVEEEDGYLKYTHSPLRMTITEEKDEM
ncbi:tyrosine-protein kinase receptor TYRO3-like isoform X1 [Solea senegalensis]|uniref:receptor protein-tyrosine kinase n=2 Tax=Solea senegalensis TaxID=28829 RepID=A0AAV6QVQ3_SOLSE|nr:tyrosine-protein kinase receptor TYRO3 [Solea senegalensis]KAG7496404.1 tyrosine-protein kinase receptor TYRO3-like isoform X1 [Solea senegalensis]